MAEKEGKTMKKIRLEALMRIHGFTLTDTSLERMHRFAEEIMAEHQAELERVLCKVLIGCQTTQPKAGGGQWLWMPAERFLSEYNGLKPQPLE